MEAPLRVRAIRLKDLDRVMEIECASFGAGAYERALFLDYHRAGGAIFIGAVRSARIVGYALAATRGSRAELVSIAVDPPERGRGAATALIESLFRRVRRRRVSHMFLMVRTGNSGAQALYRKHGFRPIRRVARYYEDGADGCLMTRDFSPGAG